MAIGHTPPAIDTTIIAPVPPVPDVVTCVVFEEHLEVPLSLRSLADFRQWVVSDEFPQTGRIDYIAGRIEVDMSPEDFICHGTLKVEMTRVLGNRIHEERRGYMVVDSSRVSCPGAALSVEPDIVFVPFTAVDSGRVRLTPTAIPRKGRYIEIEGPPDLVVEVVSDSSVNKDTVRLPRAYFAADVREYWLTDARGDEMVFVIHERGATEFTPVAIDADGFQVSAVMGFRYRLERTEVHGEWWFTLTERPV